MEMQWTSGPSLRPLTASLWAFNRVHHGEGISGMLAVGHVPPQWPSLAQLSSKAHTHQAKKGIGNHEREF